MIMNADKIMNGEITVDAHSDYIRSPGLILDFSRHKYLKWLNVLRNPLERIICLRQVNRVLTQAAASTDEWSFLSHLLNSLNVHCEFSETEIPRISSRGALVVVANHPFGGLEGVILADLLGKVRRDVKIMANYLLQPVTVLQNLFIYVDPFGTKRSVHANLSGLREVLAWLKQGGVVGVFPAGMVSHLSWPKLKVTDPAWNRNVARLIKRSRADVLPVFFDGHNSPLFQCLGLVHPRLRTALLPREFLNKKDKVIRVKIGQAIAHERLSTLGDDDKIMAYLRLRTYMLRESISAGDGRAGRFHLTRPFRKTLPEAIIPSPEAATIIREVKALPSSQILVHSRPYLVGYGYAPQIPNLLQEIGRLREVTFRQVREGTGKSIDLDRFDAHYLHLFLWEQERQEVIGAYRLGPTDRIISGLGGRGLYTATLFDYHQRFLAEINPGLELGRSFVRLEYQKNYQALLLLWKGIAQFVVRHPHYRLLFGPVSISNEYHDFSQGLLATWLSMHTFLPELARFVKPKTPLIFKKYREQDLRLALAGTQKVEELSELLADVDPGRHGVPILLKQYLKLGGKLLGFNRDPNFSQVLDGLILVDLTLTPPQVLQRYMGKAGLAEFSAYHNLGVDHHPSSPTKFADPPFSMSAVQP